MRGNMANPNLTPDELLSFQKSLLNLVCHEQQSQEPRAQEHSTRLEELAAVLVPKRKANNRRTR